MTTAEKEQIRKFFKSNFHIHSDWTGNWAEYDDHCDDVNEVAEQLISELENTENKYGIL